VFTRLSVFKNNIAKFSTEDNTNFSSLGATYNYIDSLGIFGRLLVKLQIIIFLHGEERYDYLFLFTMYAKMRAAMNYLEPK